MQPGRQLTDPAGRPGDEADSSSLEASAGWVSLMTGVVASSCSLATHDKELQDVAEDRDNEADDEPQRLEPRLLGPERKPEPAEDTQDAVDRALLDP